MRDWLESLVNSVEFELSTLIVIFGILVVAVIETCIDKDAEAQDSLRIVDTVLSGRLVSVCLSPSVSRGYLLLFLSLFLSMCVCL